MEKVLLLHENLRLPSHFETIDALFFPKTIPKGKYYRLFEFDKKDQKEELARIQEETTSSALKARISSEFLENIREIWRRYFSNPPIYNITKKCIACFNLYFHCFRLLINPCVLMSGCQLFRNQLNIHLLLKSFLVLAWKVQVILFIIFLFSLPYSSLFFTILFSCSV